QQPHAVTLLPDGQEHVKRSSAAFASRHGDATALSLDQGADEVETESHAGRGGRATPAAEAVEHAVDVLGVDPRPAIEHAQANGAAGAQDEEVGLGPGPTARGHTPTADEVD